MSMRAKMWWAAALFLLLAIGVVVGIGASVNVLEIRLPYISAKGPEPVLSSKAGSNGHYYLTLDTFGNYPPEAWKKEHNFHFLRPITPPLNPRGIGWPIYGPTANFTLPAHSLITITIQDYNGPNLIYNTFYTKAHGTINNEMTINGQSVHSWPANSIGHTFAIHSIPSAQQPWMFVAVPVPANPSSIPRTDYGFPVRPESVTFSFRTGGPGTYVWQCFAGCGIGFDAWGGPMDTPGFMSGQIVVK